jgi:HSP20 family protein
MSLVQWDPFRELDELGDRLNQLFRGGTSARGRRGEGREGLALPDWVPPVDITETPDEYQLKVDLPEISKDDVRINVDSGQLRLEGERKQEKEEKGKRVHRVERYYGSFLRTFTLPMDVDDSKIGADFKDGVLCVHLPKTEKAQKASRQIQIS